MTNSNSTVDNPKLFCLNYGECDPKKCTAIKLKRLNLLKTIKNIHGSLKNAIILNPFAQKEISNLDRKNILRFGLIVIDCSWNNILNLKEIDFQTSRRLPPLIAANPTNFGKWEKLSSVEALAAALLITGFSDHANLLLSKFSWGKQFVELNKF